VRLVDTAACSCESGQIGAHTRPPADFAARLADVSHLFRPILSRVCFGMFSPTDLRQVIVANCCSTLQIRRSLIVAHCVRPEGSARARPTSRQIVHFVRVIVAALPPVLSNAVRFVVV
jgi:hypothetical protein